MIDAHVHIAPGGGGSGLLPAEALRLAALRGFRAVGLIVRSDGGFDVSLRLLSERVQGLSLFVNVEAFVGVELVHVPPALLPDAVTEARSWFWFTAKAWPTLWPRGPTWPPWRPGPTSWPIPA